MWWAHDGYSTDNLPDHMYTLVHQLKETSSLFVVLVGLKDLFFNFY